MSGNNQVKVERKNGEIYSHIRKKWLVETPEERVRQDYLCVLVNEYGYSQINKEFLLFFLQSPAALRQMERRMTGGLYPAIIQAELEKVIVPIPSLELQKEIMKQVKEGQLVIGREREAAERKSLAIKAEIEALILGTKSMTTDVAK